MKTQMKFAMIISLICLAATLRVKEKQRFYYPVSYYTSLTPEIARIVVAPFYYPKYTYFSNTWYSSYFSPYSYYSYRTESKSENQKLKKVELTKEQLNKELLSLKKSILGSENASTSKLRKERKAYSMEWLNDQVKYTRLLQLEDTLTNSNNKIAADASAGAENQDSSLMDSAVQGATDVMNTAVTTAGEVSKESINAAAQSTSDITKNNSAASTNAIGKIAEVTNC